MGLKGFLQSSVALSVHVNFFQVIFVHELPAKFTSHTILDFLFFFKHAPQVSQKMYNSTNL